MSASGSKKAIMAALLANLGIAIAKFAAFAFTKSTSMLAEGVHSTADTGNQILLLVGGKKAEKAPDPEHPFGYGRERYFWSFVVSIILFTLGSLFAVYEAIEKILHPHELESAGWAIGVLSVAIVLEALSFRTAIREASHVRGTSTWVQFIRHSKNPELPVVLLEDLGALCGLVFALAAVITAVVTGNGVWDGVGTMAIGLLLGVIAITLSIEMKSLLIGEGADPDEEAAIARAIRESPTVRHLIYLRTQHFGPEQLLVAAKAEFDGALTMQELADAIDAVEHAVREVVPTAHYLFIEPDVRRAVRAPARAAADPPADLPSDPAAGIATDVAADVRPDLPGAATDPAFDD